MKRSWISRRGSLPSINCNNKGAVLPLVLVVMLLVFSAGGVLISQLALTVRDSNTYAAYQKAVLLGKNAVEECHAAMAADLNYTGTKYTDDDGVITTIEVKKSSTYERAITITIKTADYKRLYTGTGTYGDTGALTDFTVRLTN